MKMKLSVLLASTALLLATSAKAAVNVDSVVTSNLFEPFAVVAPADGTLYLTDGANNRIVKVAAGESTANSLAGLAGASGTNDGYGNGARFSQPQGMVLARGGLVVADSANQTLRLVSFTGVATTLAGAPGALGSANGPAASARFRYPLGLATDKDGNIFIADSLNNVIRKLDTNDNVTTVAAGFNQPAGVSVGANGDLWVADTRRHCIKVVSTNGTITVIAGIPNVNGFGDDITATNAMFSSPRGILYISPASGVLVSDSGNHAIRRIYWNTNYARYSVETYAGTPGTSGLLNGGALSSQFNGPVGLAKDEISGGFLVVDKGNNQLRRINTGAVQAPVSAPVIGWVELVKDSFGAYVTHLNPVVSAVFNNDVVIAIKSENATRTYYTVGETPANPLEDPIPTPGVGVGQTPPYYQDGQPPSEMPDTLVSPQPDMTIKAIGTQEGRRSSSVVQSRFLFQTGNPVINGDNAAAFKVDCVTTNAQLYYTWDGSDPVRDTQVNPAVRGPIRGGDFINFNLRGTNHTLKIRAYRGGYKDSDIVSKVFSPSNFVVNTVGFGFSGGEASSTFVGSAGQWVYTPVTLTLLPGQKIYTLQFNIVATNLGSVAIDPSSMHFQSMLMKPIPGITPPVYEPIPAAFSEPGANYHSLIVSNTSINLLEVGWIERAAATNLYNTLQQDLITYSQAHDRQFRSSDGRVVIGAFSFQIPLTAAPGSQYRIKLDRVSATSDGISQDVLIGVKNVSITDNGVFGPWFGSDPLISSPDGDFRSASGLENITVGSRRYIVGDVAPFRWFNAGDFGNSNIISSDLVQTFQSAVYQVNQPPADSDMLDAMDSSDGTVNNLFTGNIDQILFGDGVLNVDDVYVTFRRSLDPTLKWYARYWQNGLRQVTEVPNGSPAPPSVVGGAKTAVAKTAKTAPTGVPTVSLSVDDIVGAAGTTVSVPVRVRVSGGLPIRIAMLGLTVQPLEGAPTVTTPVSLTAAPELGAPSIQRSASPFNIAAAWLSAEATGISGDGILATLNVTIPAGAQPNAAYRVHVDHFSASENGIALFRKYVQDGLVTLSDRSGSSLSDGISDAWRLRFFGSVVSPLAAASADPDQDGSDNLKEFNAGTNPLDRLSALRLNLSPLAGRGVRLGFPTGLGRTYVIDCSPEILGPWTPIWTNTGTGAPREFTNTVPGEVKRFYRVRTQ